MKKILLLFVLFLGFSFGLVGQSYSGTVINPCTGAPLEGVTVELRGRSGYQWITDQAVTDAYGHYSVASFGADDNWNIRVIMPEGKSTPSSYNLSPSNGGSVGLDFYFLPQPTLELGSYSSSVPLPEIDPTQIGNVIPKYCFGQDNGCIFIPNDYAAQYFHGQLGATCFSAQVYLSEINFTGEKYLGDLGCVKIGGRPSIGNSNGCIGGGPYSFGNIDEYASQAIGKFLKIHITHGCCGKTACPLESKDDLNSWDIWIYIGGLSNASVDFNFNVSFPVDANNPGDPSQDGIEPISLSVPGPALGKLSTAINATIISNEQLDAMTYNLYEVDCDAGLNSNLVFTQTVDLNSQGQPQNYSFANIKDNADMPYFLTDANHLDKCFKIECLAMNDCGNVSAYSFFTIDPNQYFVMPDNDWLADQALTPELNKAEVEGLVIFPSPVGDQLYIRRVSDKQNSKLEVFDSVGRVQMTKLIQGGYSTLDVSGLQSGIYFLRIQGDEVKTLRFVKQ